jgi:hypothetical protein
MSRSQWPHPRRSSAAARLLRLWIRIPPGAWMFVCCECCLWSSRVLCDKPITRPEESYRLWCVVVSDLENSWMGRSWPTGGCFDNYNLKKERMRKQIYWLSHALINNGWRTEVISELHCLSLRTHRTQSLDPTLKTAGNRTLVFQSVVSYYNGWCTPVYFFC